MNPLVLHALCLVLGTMLVPGASSLAHAQSAADPYGQAVAAARQGRYEEALDAFQKLVAAQPQNHDARLWVARLHGWMGDEGVAESVYRAVLAESPSNVEAITGLAGLLTNALRTDEALALLADAERAAPANADVLAAIARAYYFSAETMRAAGYIERAVAISPQPDHVLLREQILRSHRHRIEVTGFTEHFTAAIPAAGSGDVTINLRASDRLRFLGRAQAQDKFDLREWRGGGGLEWRLTGSARVAGSLLVGAGTTVLPRTDAHAEFAFARGRIEWVGAIRRITFATADVWVASPAAYVSLSDRVMANARYAFAGTSFSSGPRVGSHSGAGGVSVLTGRRVWWSAGYARGTENFATLSPDRIGEFRADTISGGVRLELPNLSTVAGAYERQWRTRGTDMGRLTLTLLQRF